MKNTVNLMLLAWPIALLACQPESISTTGEQIFTLESFPVVDDGLTEATTWEVSGNLTGVYPFEDLLIIGRVGSAPPLVVYDKHTGEEITDLLGFGRGPGEVVSVPEVWQDVNRTLFAYDVTTGKILKLPSFTDEDRTVEEITRLEGQFKNMYRIAAGHEEGVLLGLTSTFGDARYYEFSLALDSMKKIGTLEPPPSNWPNEAFTPYFNVNAIFREGFLAIHPTHNWVVIAQHFHDVVSVYKDYELVTTLVGPGSNEPDFEFVKVEESLYDVHFYNNNNFTYIDVIATEDRYYVAYVNSKPTKQKCKDIFAFDWDGNPLVHFRLPYSILPATVYESETGLVEIWGQHQENGNIVQLTSTVFQ